jgi:hypothetical protein
MVDTDVAMTGAAAASPASVLPSDPSTLLAESDAGGTGGELTVVDIFQFLFHD